MKAGTLRSAKGRPCVAAPSSFRACLRDPRSGVPSALRTPLQLSWFRIRCAETSQRPLPDERLELDPMRLIRIRPLPPPQVLDVRPVVPLEPDDLRIPLE